VATGLGAPEGLEPPTLGLKTEGQGPLRAYVSCLELFSPDWGGVMSPIRSAAWVSVLPYPAASVLQKVCPTGPAKGPVEAANPLPWTIPTPVPLTLAGEISTQHVQSSRGEDPELSLEDRSAALGRGLPTM
jgi:hypothetical protein